MDSRGYCHRDLKPENIFLDHEFDLKLADLGFATKLDKVPGREMLVEYLGTPGYMAPEQIEGLPYSGQAVDIFASGVILFILMTQHPPFVNSASNDKLYKYIKCNRTDVFW